MDAQTIYLVRHAETNMNGKYCGSKNPSLSWRGRLQAKKLHERFKRIPIDVCFYSPLTRTKQTAKAIRKNKLFTIKSADQIREISFGKWEGKTFEEVRKNWPKLYSRWIKNPTKSQIPDGELFMQFCKRVKKFKSILLNVKEKNILVVSHGGTLSVLFMLLTNKNLNEFWKWAPPLASVTEFKKYLYKGNPKLKLIRFKEISHLEK